MIKSIVFQNGILEYSSPNNDNGIYWKKKKRETGAGCVNKPEQSWMEYKTLSRLLSCRILQLLVNNCTVWILKMTGMQCTAFLSGVSWANVPWIMVRKKNAPVRSSLLTGSHRSYIYMSYQITDGFEFALAPRLGRTIIHIALSCSCGLW